MRLKEEISVLRDTRASLEREVSSLEERKARAGADDLLYGPSEGPLWEGEEESTTTAAVRLKEEISVLRDTRASLEREVASLEERKARAGAELRDTR